MNWYNIKNTHPKSFLKFTEKMFPNVGIPCVSSLSFFDKKKLYGFFDDNGIYLNVEMYNPIQWSYTISLSNGFVLGITTVCKQNRDEIETEGFEECFKILEKRL